MSVLTGGTVVQTHSQGHAALSTVVRQLSKT